MSSTSVTPSVATVSGTTWPSVMVSVGPSISGASLTFVKVIVGVTVAEESAPASVAVTVNVGAASPPSWTKLTSPATTCARVKLVTALPPNSKLPPVGVPTSIVMSASA